MSVITQSDIVFMHPSKSWVVLHKPAGFSIDDLAIAYQQQFPQFHPTHRLDKETSGLWLIALTRAANQYFSSQFQQQRIHKTYLAIISGGKRLKKKQGTIKGDMQPSRRKSWKLLATQENPAETAFQSFAFNGHAGLRITVLKPKTGKTHQLRVAMKANGSAICGDTIYAKASAENFDRLYLHAYALRFEFDGQAFELQALPTSGSLFLEDSFVEYCQGLADI